MDFWTKAEKEMSLSEDQATRTKLD